MLDDARRFVKFFGGCGYGDCAGGPSELFVLPAVGLLVASFAMFFHGILSVRMESIHLETQALQRYS